jgi:hypothetical protein
MYVNHVYLKSPHQPDSSMQARLRIAVRIVRIAPPIVSSAVYVSNVSGVSDVLRSVHTVSEPGKVAIRLRLVRYTTTNTRVTQEKLQELTALTAGSRSDANSVYGGVTRYVVPTTKECHYAKSLPA